MRVPKPNKKTSLILILLLIAVLLAIIFGVRQASAPESTSTTSKAVKTDKDSQEKEFDKGRYSLDDPTSIWVVVNKKRPLPDGYAPNDLTASGVRAEADKNLSKLLAEAQKSGYPLQVLSAFRSQGEQAATYSSYAAKDGQAKADTYSARPGHSEHQTGWAADVGNGVCNLEICFGDTPAGKWLAENTHNYGFIIRYEKGKEGITGYQYEPWHIRYVGKELAHELAHTNQTLEEFFNLPPAPNY